MERRIVTVNMEIRQDADEGAVITGYAARYNALSDDLGGFREIIRPGFFEGVLSDDVRALFNHDSNYVLGRTEAGTLELSDDVEGLTVAIRPPDTQWARDLITSMRRGDVNQMSFGFSVRTDAWKTIDGEARRELIKAERLYDVSVVTFPAYPQTSAEARAKAEALTSIVNPAEPDGQAADDSADSPLAATAQARHAARRRHIEILKRR